MPGARTIGKLRKELEEYAATHTMKECADKYWGGNVHNAQGYLLKNRIPYKHIRPARKDTVYPIRDQVLKYAKTHTVKECANKYWKGRYDIAYSFLSYHGCARTNNGGGINNDYI